MCKKKTCDILNTLLQQNIRSLFTAIAYKVVLYRIAVFYIFNIFTQPTVWHAGVFPFSCENKSLLSMQKDTAKGLICVLCKSHGVKRFVDKCI